MKTEKRNRKVLLIYPHSMRRAYTRSKVSVAVPETPSLSLAAIAAPLLNAGHEVEIIDLEFSKNPIKDLIRKTHQLEGVQHTQTAVCIS